MADDRIADVDEHEKDREVEQVDLFGDSERVKRPGPESYIKRELNWNLSGNEVCYTNSLILLVKNMLCSKLHRHTDFYLIIFSFRIWPRIQAF